MQPERWRTCTEIFDAVVDCAPAERATLLAQRCGGNEQLRRDVELLLKGHQEAEGFIESPAFETAPELLIDDPDALVGQRIGHYRIESVLGVGGMGIVYLAHDEQLERKVALKLLPQLLVADEAQLQRLIHEARTASALNHPNIVTIHEIGEVEGTHYIATEYIEGITLRERIARGMISPEAALDLASQIASALCVAHAAGIVHSDIKPENIMIRPDGYVKVLDFGIARFAPLGTPLAEGATPGPVLGTARYMSPEQAGGQPVDARSDLWSFGVTLYEMLTGRAPFAGETAADVQAAVQSEPIDPLGEMPMRAIVQKALQKNPAERYQTAEKIFHDLRALKENDGSRANRKTRRRLAIVSAAAILLALFFVYRGASVAPEISSIAVLPFQDTDPDPTTEYLVDGLTENLINNLATLPRIRVMARSTAFTYKGKTIDPQTIGRDLKVDAIITGRISRRNEQIGLQVELVKTADGSQVWGVQHQRAPAELPALQSQILRAVSEKLRPRLSLAEQSRVARQHTADVEAYRSYLRGLFHQEKRTQKDLQESVTHFERAIERDPIYAQAYAGLAESYRLYGNYDVAPPIVACPKAKAAALKALELDDTLADAHTTLGMIFLSFDWNLPAAEKEFQRALELNPNDSKAYHRYGNSYLLVARRFDEAIAAMKRAEELDPLAPIIATNLGETYAAAGKLDQAIEQLQKTILIYPTFANAYFDLGRAYLLRRDFAAALKEFETGSQIAPNEAGLFVMVGVAHAFAGERAAAAAVLDRVHELSSERYFPPYYVAMIHAGLGEKDQALTLLEKACADRAAEMVFLDQEQAFAGLHSASRFRELLRRVRAGAPAG